MPEFFCPEGELAIYDKLLAELQASGKEEEGLWALWHGDSHVIANDRKGWKKTCPTFTKLVRAVHCIYRSRAGMCVRTVHNDSP